MIDIEIMIKKINELFLEDLHYFIFTVDIIVVYL
jgi:hypothetical protein